MTNISRDGAPKKTQTKFETATPPHIVKLGPDNVPVPIPGLSRTESSKLFEGDKLGTVNDGGESGNYKSGHLAQAPKIHPSMTSERQKNATVDNGDAILRGAVLSGSTKLPPAVNEVIDKSKPARLPD
jgi:hypothetical protein